MAWALIAALGLAACGGPIGPLPGGRLEGAEDACPGNGFAFASEVDNVEMELRPSNPYSVTTRAVVVQRGLYLPANFGNPLTRWPFHAANDSRVRVRVAGKVYACHAVRVTDRELLPRLRSEAQRKYGGYTSDDDELWWFHISPRLPGG